MKRGYARRPLRGLVSRICNDLSTQKAFNCTMITKAVFRRQSIGAKLIHPPSTQKRRSLHHFLEVRHTHFSCILLIRFFIVPSSPSFLHLFMLRHIRQCIHTLTIQSIGDIPNGNCFPRNGRPPPSAMLIFVSSTLSWALTTQILVCFEVSIQIPVTFSNLFDACEACPMYLETRSLSHVGRRHPVLVHTTQPPMHRYVDSAQCGTTRMRTTSSFEQI